MAQKFVGIDLGTHHVKVSVLSSGLRGAQVLDAFEEPVGPPSGEEGVDPLSQVLSVALNLLRSRGLMSEAVGICLPGGLMSYRVLGFPFSDERRIAQAVGFEAEGQFPVPIEELEYGHLVVPASDGGGRALVVAAKKTKVEQIASIFRKAGVDLKVITAGSIAAAQVAGTAIPEAAGDGEEGSQPVALLVDLGHSSTDFVALGPKGPLAVRTLRRGGKHVTQAVARRYQLDWAAAEAAKHSDAFLPHRGFESISHEQMDAGKVIATAFEPVLRELEHTRLWLRATYRLEVGKLVLGGGGADLNGVEEYLAEHTGLPVERFEPGASGLKGTQGRRWETTAASLGAAYGAARRPLLRLQDMVTGDGEGGWVQERLSGLIALGVAVMAFGALDTIAKVKAAEAELAAHRDELEEASKRVFGSSMNPQEVKSELDAVEGQDLTSLIPERGALEVLALITKAATPSDLAQAQAQAQAAMFPGGSAAVPGANPAQDGGSGGAEEDGEDAEEEEASAASSGPVDPTSGIKMEDELVFKTLDIRERKIELEAEANKSSAQDRLNFKLKQTGCIINIQNGAIKGADRKRFEMSMDNNCYHASSTTTQDEEEEE